MASYSEFMAWIAYSKAELATSEIDEERAAHDVKVMESKSLINQWSAEAKGDRVTIAKARRDVEPDVIQAQEKLLQARAYRKLVEAMYDRCDKGAQVLSRELSRRIGLAPRERSGSRYAP